MILADKLFFCMATKGILITDAHQPRTMASTKKTASTSAKEKTSAKAAPAKAAPQKADPKKAAPAAPAPGPAPKKPAAKATSKPASKAAAKATTSPAAKKEVPAKAAPQKTVSKPTPAPQAEATAPRASKPTPAKPAAATPPAAKPAAKPAASRREGKDGLTAEERERVKKLRATLALLKADPEWPAFLEEQKAALLALRDQLLPNMQNTTRDHLRSGASNVSSSSGQHIGDAGSEAEVRDLTINLLNKDREQLFEIDAAMERIRRGTYGICEISLDPIPKGRLRVRPFCRLTVKCQEEYEKKYGSYANFKAKNSDHVGYSGLQNDMKNAISLDDSEE